MSNFPLPYSSLKRSTKPIRAKKKPLSRVGKEGIVRLKGPDLEKLRKDCWERDRGRCQTCSKLLWWDTEWKGHPDRYHMAHVGNKRMYGDKLENVRSLCGNCHRAEHGNPLPKGIRG